MRLGSLLKKLRRGRDGSEGYDSDSLQIPRSIAIIMDGNGRWAADRRLPAIAGHREGARALKRTVHTAREAGVRELTVYAFSTENWQRPESEISNLMTMFSELIDKEIPELHKQGIRIRFIGRRQQLSEELLRKMAESETLTADNTAMTLFVAFNYGGRAEIIDAVRAAGSKASECTEESFRQHLYAPDMLDPELLIRTSGEQRLSNFLLWQCAYSEFYFSDKLWPSFQSEDLMAAIREFNRRQRRFGAR